MNTASARHIDHHGLETLPLAEYVADAPFRAGTVNIYPSPENARSFPKQLSDAQLLIRPPISRLNQRTIFALPESDNISSI